MQDFAAIDFETANYEPTSICSIGVVVVRGGRVAERFYSLVRPEPEYYCYANVRVHGIRACDTRTARPFPDVWAEVAPLVAGLPLVAHNKAFDERCLRAAFRCYGMDYPDEDYTFHCTCIASRRQLGCTLPNHQLHTVAAYCGYELTNHHHALADAEACAAIAIQLL